MVNEMIFWSNSINFERDGRVGMVFRAEGSVNYL